MGANASTAVPLYASGEVLDAARLNLTNAGVPVFSGTATRDAAFGGSGEKVLAEGQLCYLEDANVVQYYDGASFATVGPATPTPSALTLISSTAFATAASVSLPTNTFTATYDNYLVIIQTTAISTTMSITGRFRAAGTDNTSSEYSNMFNLVDNNAGGNSSISNNSQASFALGSAQTSRPYQGFIDVTTPFLTQQTCIHPRLETQTAGSLSQVLQGAGRYQLTNSFDSFSFICSTGTFTGTVRAYGYANS